MSTEITGTIPWINPEIELPPFDCAVAFQEYGYEEALSKEVHILHKDGFCFNAYTVTNGGNKYWRTSESEYRLEDIIGWCPISIPEWFKK